mmetsp:Transcript_5011/g.7547  ORF Transcript_5011/g.7547 Transcript_5011/m.7547 type:complete len:224 (-) Transcript_5011:722-1393(-)
MAEQFKSGSAPGSRRPLFFANIERNSSEFSHPSMSYNFWMFSVFALARIAGTKSVGSGNFSALTTDFRTSSVSESPVSNTIPGQSIRKIRFINVIYCQTFVSPGIGATLQTFFVLMVFMREDLPTFGYPTIPTLICFLSECNWENCLRRFISVLLPKEFVIEAWKAIVGTFLPRRRIHFLVAQFGTRSTLFITKIKCLWDAFLAKCFSKCSHLVPGTFLASKT